jgi:hypothetical protein
MHPVEEYPMPEILVVCPSCSRSVLGRNLRTSTFGNRVIPVCKACFLKLKKENGTDSMRQAKLAKQVKYTQPELPF